MKKCSALALLSGLVCLSLSYVSADDPSNDDVFLSLTRTPVRRNDLPTNVTVISAEEIRQSGARTLAEALERAPGVQIANSGSLGSLASVRIRGVPTSNQVQVLMDDQPLGGVSIQNIDIALIPTDDIERIEVVRGGASVLYGANTIGGVIHIFTKKHTNENARAALTMEQGSLNTSKVGVEAGAKGNQASGYLSAGQYSTDGFQENSDIQNHNGSANLGYAFANGVYAQAQWSAFANEGGLPSGTPVPFDQWNGHLERQANTPTARYDHSVDTARLKTDIPVGEIGKAQVSGYGSREGYHAIEFGNVFDNRVEGGDAHLSLFEGTMLGSAVEHDSRTSEGQVGHHINNWALYAQQELKSTRWSVIPAIRYDHHSQFGGVTNPRLTTVFQAQPDLKFSANVARSFRAPTLVDLYENFLFSDFPEFNFYGNPNLKPETGWTYDAGLWSQVTSDLTFQLTAFYTTIRNRITPVDTNGDGNSDTLQNVARAEIAGTEVEMTLQDGAWNHQLNFTVQQAQGTSATESHYVYLRYTPDYLVNYEASLRLPREWAWRNSVHLQDTSFENDNEKGAELPAYYWWNTRLEKTIGNALLFVEARNVTDQRYAETATFGNPVPLPGRTFDGGVRLTFGGTQ